MKTLFLLLFILPFTTHAQRMADCRDMTVRSIQHRPSDSLPLRISIDNNCTDCKSGLDACVYMQLVVVRTVAPFDTVANSQCYCLVTPDNQSTRQYQLHMYTEQLPVPEDLAVRFEYCEGCSELPMALATGVQDETPSPDAATISVFPNPVINQLHIRTHGHSGYTARLIDVQGRLHATAALDASETIIETDGLASGVYIAQIIAADGSPVRQVTLLKR